MSDLTKLQALLGQELRLACEVQGAEQGPATLTLSPDGQRVLGPAGSQLVYTFQEGQLVSLEIMVAAG
jgi:hypothetical protein